MSSFTAVPSQDIPSARASKEDVVVPAYIVGCKYAVKPDGREVVGSAARLRPGRIVLRPHPWPPLLKERGWGEVAGHDLDFRYHCFYIK